MRQAGTRHPKKALTAKAVENAREPGKYFDGHGLYLRVDSGGGRYWVQRITIRGKRREIGIGNPDLVSLAEARTQALHNKQIAVQGLDPIQNRQEARAVPTFEEAARKVHEINAPTWRNQKHAAQFISTLETYAFPSMGRLRVSDATTADVLAVLTPIWTTKHETARRVRQRIGTVMKWAVAKGWRQDNPAESISLALPKVRKDVQHRRALPYSEVPACVDAIRASRAGLSTKLALEFLVLTAARSNEVRGAAWAEIDLGAGIWTIPAQRMKAKRPHRVPLAPRAIEVLAEARGLTDGAGLVFPGTVKGKPLSDATLRKLVREHGFAVDIHGFRTGFRMWAQERTRFPREVAEAALAHQIGDATERAYARSDLFDTRRAMMDAWARFLAMEPANVYSLARSGRHKG